MKSRTHNRGNRECWTPKPVWQGGARMYYLWCTACRHYYPESNFPISRAEVYRNGRAYLCYPCSRKHALETIRRRKLAFYNNAEESEFVNDENLS